MTQVQYRDMTWLQSGLDINGIQCDEYLLDDGTTIWLSEFEDVEVEMDDRCLNSYVDKDLASLYNTSTL